MSLPLSARAAAAALALLPLPALAGAAVGAPAPDFALADLSGRTLRLSDYRGRVVVLEWTNPECPFVRKHYLSGNMPGLQKSAASAGVVWLSINSGYAGSAGDYDPARAAKWLGSTGAAPAAYLRDPDGRVGRLYGAKATPDMYVIAPDGTLAYAGAIDSIPSVDRSDIARATNYVAAALEAVRQGRPVAVAVTRPYGCSIKY